MLSLKLYFSQSWHWCILAQVEAPHPENRWHLFHHSVLSAVKEKDLTNRKKFPLSSCWIMSVGVFVDFFFPLKFCETVCIGNLPSRRPLSFYMTEWIHMPWRGCLPALASRHVTLMQPTTGFSSSSSRKSADSKKSTLEVKKLTNKQKNTTHLEIFTLSLRDIIKQTLLLPPCCHSYELKHQLIPQILQV